MLRVACQWFRPLIGAMLAVVLMSGCVTSYEAGAPKVDLNKALESHISLGMGYVRDNKRDSARLHFQKALKIKPNSPGALSGMALLLQIEGEPKEAEKHFKKALSANPKFSQGRLNYGSFLYQRERLKEAFDQFEIVSKDLNYAGRSAGLLNLGRTAQRLGRAEKAEAAFKHAVSIDPRQSQAILELADIYYQQKKYAESKRYLDMFAKVARQNPRSLLLGIRIERIFGNKDKEASHALALKNLYPYSNEYLEYQRAMSQ